MGCLITIFLHGMSMLSQCQLVLYLKPRFAVWNKLTSMPGTCRGSPLESRTQIDSSITRFHRRYSSTTSTSPDIDHSLLLPITDQNWSLDVLPHGSRARAGRGTFLTALNVRWYGTVLQIILRALSLGCNNGLESTRRLSAAGTGQLDNTGCRCCDICSLAEERGKI